MTTPTSTQTPLQHDLNDAARQLAQVVPPAALSTINTGIDQLVASGIIRHSLPVGAVAPDFTLPRAGGGTLTLSEVVQSGPAVVVYYRGEWCPYCNLQLRSYQHALPDFRKYNTSLIAISPQTPDNSLTTVEQKGLAFPVLSDTGNVVASQFGLAYQVDRTVIDTLGHLGIDLAVYNGDTSGTLPLTATFVIDQARVIRWTRVDADFRQRPDASELLAALITL